MSMLVAGRYYTLDEYHRLGDIGVLSEDDRVELIEGEIVAMAAIKGPHMLGINRLTYTLVDIPGRTWIVSVQNPVHLLGDTEPQPDIALLRQEAERVAVPEAADVYLIIEVSDTTLSYDRGDYQIVDQSVPGNTIDSLILPAIRLSVAALFA